MPQMSWRSLWKGDALVHDHSNKYTAPSNSKNHHGRRWSALLDCQHVHIFALQLVVRVVVCKLYRFKNTIESVCA